MSYKTFMLCALQADQWIIIPAAGKVVSNFFLVVPKETVEGDDVGIVYERQAMITRIKDLAVGGNLCEKPDQTQLGEVKYHGLFFFFY